MSEGERRLAAIMFTDMVGFTAITQADEAHSMKLLDRHHRLIRPFFPKYHGREVKTIGDSFLVEFGSALDATNCAVEIQRFLHDYNLTSDDSWQVRIRVGVHLGDVIHAGTDVFGDAVNIASRIEPLAEPEGVCISEQVFDQVRNKLSQPLLKLPDKLLKNVRTPIDVYKVSMEWETEPRVLESQPSPNVRIAVLPLANLSPDPQDEFFADGLTEELITELSRVPKLRVIARTSVMHYKNSPKGVQEIGRELKVGSVLEGSIRKAGNKIRITAQLIDADSEEHLWADSYDRELNDIFAVQSEIASSVAGALQLKLLTQPGPAPGRTEDMEAYTLYLRGRFLWNRRSSEGLREALSCFERALKKDPGYARAYSGIADCYSVLVDRNEIPWSEGWPKAKAACERALVLDENLPEAHASMVLIATRILDYAAVEREYKRAVELNPGYASAHQWYGIALGCMGRTTEATAAMAKAEEADPLSPIILHNSGFMAWVQGRDEVALEKWNRALEVNPSFDVVLFDLACYNAKVSRPEEALRAIRALEAVASQNKQTRAILAYVYGLAGMRDEAERLLLFFLEEASHGRAPAAQVAWIYAGLGDVDKFYDWAFKSVEDRSLLPVWLRLHPLFDRIRADPRYPEFLAGWKLPQ